MRLLIQGVLSAVLLVGPLSAAQRFIVQVVGGLPPLNTACVAFGCDVVEDLGAPNDQFFLITIPDGRAVAPFVQELSQVPGVVDLEPDLIVSLSQSGPTAPAALYDTRLVPYFGVDVRHGYVAQPAAKIVSIHKTQHELDVAGRGTVAIIDTGVDPTHPVLQNVLVPGYDFTRNEQGYGSEDADLNQSTVAVVDGDGPADVNGSTVATVGQSNASQLNTPQYADFGHGTMVAGVVHLVAPKAMIMALKAFQADGSGYLSDIVRALYWAANHNARVVNMSFSMAQRSTALNVAIDYVTTVGLICVASVGNQGIETTVYPAAFKDVMGVASTSNNDVRSTFSNYGTPLVWVAAPGEGIITIYPFGAYAAAWGTSFSAPFVTGTVALLLDVSWNMGYSEAAQAIAQAKPIDDPTLGHGLLDIYLAVQAAKSPQFALSY